MAKSKGGGSKPPSKQSGDRMSSLAGRVMAGQKPTPAQARQLAASVLGQDETKGPRKK